MASALHVCAEDWHLDGKLTSTLEEKGFGDFFPIQRQVIPLLLAQNSSPCIYPQDICVSAPTGSGKTLSYALPVLNTLLSSSESFATNRRLRALILLPSRELAQQVFTVFTDLVADTNIKVALTTGARPLAKEQELITGLSSRKIQRSDHDELHLGRSTVDVMISTPGRLLDHIHFTTGFTLQHLRFLVLDEADRLLGNAYHSWVRTLMNSTDQVRTEQSLMAPLDTSSLNSLSSDSLKRRKLEALDGARFKMPLQRLLFSATLSEEPAALALMGVRNPLFIRAKGTLVDHTQETKDGEEDENEAVEEWEDSYQIPQTLAERQVQVDTQTRLLVLLNVLLNTFRRHECSGLGLCRDDEEYAEHRGLCGDAGSIVLIFVSSVETSHRLASFLQVVNGQFDLSESRKVEALAGLQKDMDAEGSLLFNGRVEEMSRLISTAEREAVVQDAALGKVSIIVSSDRMARGIDLAGVKLVVNFDCPNNIKTYIHRAGRTARANRFGLCLTFLKKGQSTQFKKMRLEVSGNKPAEGDKVVFPVRNLRLDGDMDEYLTKPYHEAVRLDCAALTRSC